VISIYTRTVYRSGWMVRLIKTSIHDSQILVSQEMEPAARVL